KHEIAALYGRNLAGLRITGFQVVWKENLPAYFTNAIELEDFQDVSIDSFSGRQAFRNSTSSVINLRRGKGISIRNSNADPATGTFLSSNAVSGQRMFVNNDLSEARQVFSPNGNGFSSYGNRLPPA